REEPLSRARIHVEARREAGGCLRLAPRAPWPRAPPRHRTCRRGALCRAADGALRGARIPLLSRRGVGEGSRIPAQGRTEGSTGVCQPRSRRTLRTGSGGDGAPRGGCRSTHTLQGVPSPGGHLYGAQRIRARGCGGGEGRGVAPRERRRLGGGAGEGEALAGLGWAATWGHRFDAAVDYANRAIDISTAAGALAPVAASQMAIGLVRGNTGRLTESRVHYEQARAIGQRVADVS